MAKRNPNADSSLITLITFDLFLKRDGCKLTEHIASMTFRSSTGLSQLHSEYIHSAIPMAVGLLIKITSMTMQSSE